jgi:hypothetical protein
MKIMPNPALLNQNAPPDQANLVGQNIVMRPPQPEGKFCEYLQLSCI